MKKPQTLKRELKKLRAIVETSKDPVEARIAYTLETAIRWATEDTVGWKRPHTETKDIATMVRNGI